MNLRKIQDAEVKDKKVLLRVDFNVAIENGEVKESFKLEACRQSVDYLLEKGAKVALISHLGRPDGKVDLDYSLEQLVADTTRILEKRIIFFEDCIGEGVAEKIGELEEGEIILLENARFYEGEEKNDHEFAAALAENFDLFINEAFSVCHRDQASVTGVAKILPSYAGFWLQKEIENLDKVKENPEHPAIAIIGGAKIETKLPLIQSFEKSYDHILVGGKIANEAFDEKLKFSDKISLPVDSVGERMDIGPKTIAQFSQIINSAKTIVWNGPVGKFEEKPYDIGTKSILEAVIASGAYVLMGGGESVEILEENGAMAKIGFVSTGGGAMLEYLSGNQMPGIQALSVD